MKLLNSKFIRISNIICAMLVACIAAVALSDNYVRSQVPVSLGFGSTFVDLWDDGYVVLEGTWKIEGGKHAYPLNSSKIVCRAQSKTCIDSIARIYIGNGLSLLNVDEDMHEITRWDKETLIYQSGTKCVDYFYTVSRATKQVTGMRKLKTGIEKGFCGGLDEELKLQLSKGFDVSRQMQEDARPVAVNVAALLLILAYGVFRIRRVVKEQNATKNQ